jgi:cysteine-rich repeat protein
MSPSSTRQDLSTLRRAAGVALAAALAATPASAQYLHVPTFGVVTPAGWRSGSSDVAVGRDGSVVLVWDHSVETGRPPRPRELAIQRFTAEGVALAPAVRMSVSPRVNDATPRIVGDETGGYLLTWTGGHLGTDVTPMGQRLDAAGVPVGKTFQVDVSNKNQSIGRSTAIAALPASEVIVWFDGGPGDGILSRRFDRLGTQLQTPVIVRAPAAPEDGCSRRRTADSSSRSARAGRRPGSTASGFPAPRPRREPKRELRGPRRQPGRGRVRRRHDPPAGYFLAAEIWLQRFTRDGALLGPEVLVHDAGPDMHVIPSVAFDANDNLIVTWSEVGASGTTFRARGLDPTGVPIGPAVTLQTESGAPLDVHTVRLADGFRFLSTWPREDATAVAANVVSLCVPGASVCGDGTRHPLCERCDAGVGNSDTTPDACRTDCRPAHCGDGTIDTAEECDDGNTDDCDGCSSACHAEIGLVCGDGIPYPACGQMLRRRRSDRSRRLLGDRTLERIPGGGSPPTECKTEWVVDDPGNEPYLDTDGAVSGTQRCVDDDPAGRTDGGVPGCLHVPRRGLRQQHRSRHCEPGTASRAGASRHRPRRRPPAIPRRPPCAMRLAGAVLPSIVGLSAPTSAARWRT